MTIQISIIRTPRTLATSGELYIDDVFFCYTLELPYRNNQPFISAIPEGEYTLTLTPANKILLVGTSPRSGILIHKGNTIADTQGCILVGDALSADGNTLAAGTSGPAYIRLLNYIYSQLFTRNQTIELEITVVTPRLKLTPYMAL